MNISVYILAVIVTT